MSLGAVALGEFALGNLCVVLMRRLPGASWLVNILGSNSR